MDQGYTRMTTVKLGIISFLLLSVLTVPLEVMIKHPQTSLLLPTNHSAHCAGTGPAGDKVLEVFGEGCGP